MAILIKDYGPKIIVNAAQELFLDYNLTPVFQLS